MGQGVFKEGKKDNLNSVLQNKQERSKQGREEKDNPCIENRISEGLDSVMSITASR